MTHNITLHNVTPGMKVTNTFTIGTFGTRNYQVIEFNVVKTGKIWEIRDMTHEPIATARTLKDARQAINQQLNNLQAA